MTPSELAHSALTDAQPPRNLSAAWHALWLAKAGRWEEAHDACQEIPGPTGSWIHAHLHREEGDHDNASYWYHRAQQPVPPRSLSIAEEWLQLATVIGPH